jgi:hypothetical protein
LRLYSFADGTEIPVGPSGIISYGSISPDNAYVAFGQGSISLVATTGSAQPVVVLELGMQDTGVYYPVFTPDSKRLLYGGLAAVDSVLLDGTDVETVLAEPSAPTNPAPAFSPNYQSLAAIVNCDEGSEPVGSGWALLVYPYASLPAPCDSGVVVTSVPANAANTSLAWGPGFIAFVQGNDVWIVDADGGTPTNLTQDLTSFTTSGGEPGGTVASNPTWAPACTKL